MGSFRLFGREITREGGVLTIQKTGTLAERSTLALLNGPFAEDQGKGNVKNHIWVHNCVNVLMRCVMRGDYKLYNNGVQGPTPFDDIFDETGGNTPSSTLFMETAMWWWWEGEFFWVWEKGFMAPDQITVLDPRKVYTKKENGETKYYFTTGKGEYVQLMKGQFLHIKLPNIYNPERGVFPLYAAGMSLLKQDKLITDGHLDALRSGAVPDVLIKNKLRLTEPQAAQAIKYWNSSYNRPSGGSRVAVLGGGSDVQVLSQDLIKYIDLMDWNRSAITAAYGIPLKVLNAETGKTALSGKDSNEQYRALFSQTIIPQLKYWSGEINRQFFSALGYRDVSGEFDLSNVAELQEDTIKVHKMENEDIVTGVVTINEIRARRGQDPVDWGDKPPVNKPKQGVEE